MRGRCTVTYRSQSRACAAGTRMLIAKFTRTVLRPVAVTGAGKRIAIFREHHHIWALFYAHRSFIPSNTACKRLPNCSYILWPTIWVRTGQEMGQIVYKKLFILTHRTISSITYQGRVVAAPSSEDTTLVAPKPVYLLLSLLLSL